MLPLTDRLLNVRVQLLFAPLQSDLEPAVSIDRSRGMLLRMTGIDTMLSLTGSMHGLLCCSIPDCTIWLHRTAIITQRKSLYVRTRNMSMKKIARQNRARYNR